MCLEGIDNGIYMSLPHIMRAEYLMHYALPQAYSLIINIYLMPLVHAEDLPLQQQCVDMYKELYDEVASMHPEAKLIYERFCR